MSGPKSFRPRLEQCESRDVPAGAFGKNLIFNGGAESGAVNPGLRGYQVVRPIPEWFPVGNFTKIQYGPESSAEGFPWVRDRPFGGAFFAGGPNNAKSSAQQIEVLSNYDTSIIKRGGVGYELSGWFGGYLTQNDSATLTVRFQDGAAKTLATATVGGVTAAARGYKTDFVFRETAGPVPLGTRRIQTILSMNRGSGSYNDGYADNLSLILTNNIGSRIQFSAPTFTVNEGVGTVSFTLTRTGYVGNSGNVMVSTDPGIATAGKDFLNFTRRVTFAPGQRTRTITLTIVNDKVRESTEFMYLGLSLPAGDGVRVGTPKSLKVTIKDND